MADDVLRHPLTGQPIVPVGFRIDGRPIWPVIGAAPEEGEGEEEGEGGETEGEGGEGDEGEGGDTGAEWKPPTKAEWEKVKKALSKANNEAKTYREKGKKAAEDAETEADKKDREREERFNAKFIRSEVKSALLAAHAKSDRVAALVKLTDLTGVTVDKDGEVSDLDDLIETAKNDYPEFFDGRTTGKSGNAGTGEKKSPKKELSYAQQLFANARS